jgi:hypothetical protein
MSKWTENTMRKKGRKWSNISVKKYHQTPGFGVRSGRVSDAPQDLETQVQFPATSVEISVKMVEYTATSTTNGKVLRRFAEKGFGDANFDTGEVIRRRRIGKSNRIDEGESWRSKENARRAGEAWPCDANIIESNVSVLSNDEVDNASVGRKM